MTNRLARETSPYLRQHKDNPVDWYPWGPEALARAKAENRPILLSVGYSACHWCHVMAHESFEDEATAALMNKLFVNIKLDREERPDLDAIYQSALAVMGEQGGWPLTMFLTPDLKPFTGGTYYPPEPRYGRPSFRQVLTEIARVWREEPERARNAEAALMPHLQRALNPTAEGELTFASLDLIAARLVKAIDPVFGGVGNAPKFPNTPILELLWRAYMRTGDEAYRTAVETSLVHMCQGGIYDHLGGGFARYSVDRQWLTPHFEKMLYDNAQLISLMTLVWRKTRSPLLAARIDETIQWVMREMVIEGKGFASSLDADSEGHEGRFYVWSKPEIVDILGTDDAELFCSVYGVTETGNFEGANILNRPGSLELRDEAHEMRLKRTREELLAARAGRVRPGRDDKVLTEWNGLMVKALAEAGAAFGRADWLDEAEGPLNLISTPSQGFEAAAQTSEAFANMSAAGLAYFEARADDLRLYDAHGWIAQTEAEFSSPDGAFYQSPKNATDVIVRSRTIYDNAVPPANATMLANYARLYTQTGESRYREAAEAIIRLFAGVALQTPSGTASFLNAFELFVMPLAIFVVAPNETSTDSVPARAPELANAALACADPNRIVVWVPGGAAYPEGHPARDKKAIDGKPTAYVCRGPVCSAPVTNPKELARLLERP